MNWYNEIDPYCCDWLENLIREKLIPEGVVDRRDIRLVRPDDLAGFTQCHFFAGIGGWPLSLHLAGWPSDRPCWTGSCPCQPFSAAGKRKGFADDRHLWPEFRRLIAERSPPVVFGEQVASATEWLRLVRGDLEALGYAVGAIPVEAASAGADHLRDRFWFVADREGEQVGAAGQSRERGDVEYSDEIGIDGSGDFRPRRRTESQDASSDLGDTDEPGLAVGSIAEIKRGNLRDERPATGASSDRSERADQRAAGAAGVADAGSGELWNEGCRSPLGASEEISGEVRQQRLRPDAEPEGFGGPAFDWVIGADGKARRVKSGVRLLAHGVPDRVAKLRAFGNAIDPRPASEFIKAFKATLEA